MKDKKSTGDILYAKSRKNSDECYTPRYTVIPIVRHILLYEDKIGRNVTVWLPFDKEDSEFVKVLQEVGVNYVASHIDEGKDFFEYEPENWDIIVSNSPWKNKKFFFERALSLGKPFALLMTTTWLNDAAVFKLFAKYNKDLQLLTFDKRTHYLDNEKKDMGRPSFGSAYYCCDFLQKQIMFEILEKKV